MGSASISPVRKEGDQRLTGREYEVLLWAARGKTYRDSAAILGLSPGSIKTHLDTARFRLRAVNVTHAVALAFTLGIFTAQTFAEKRTVSDVLD